MIIRSGNNVTPNDRNFYPKLNGALPPNPNQINF